MSAVTAAVRIERSRDAVFDFISRPENWPTFRPSVLRCETVSGHGVGTLIRGATRVGGRAVAWTAEVTVHDRPHRYAVRSLDSPAPFELEWTLVAPSDDTCVLRFHQQAPDRHGLLARIAELLVTPRYEADLRHHHAHLATLLAAS